MNYKLQNLSAVTPAVAKAHDESHEPKSSIVLRAIQWG